MSFKHYAVSFKPIVLLFNKIQEIKTTEESVVFIWHKYQISTILLSIKKCNPPIILESKALAITIINHNQQGSPF